MVDLERGKNDGIALAQELEEANDGDESDQEVWSAPMPGGDEES